MTATFRTWSTQRINLIRGVLRRSSAIQHLFSKVNKTFLLLIWPETSFKKSHLKACLNRLHCENVWLTECNLACLLAIRRHLFMAKPKPTLCVRTSISLQSNEQIIFLLLLLPHQHYLFLSLTVRDNNRLWWLLQAPYHPSKSHVNKILFSNPIS